MLHAAYSGHQEGDTEGKKNPARGAVLKKEVGDEVEGRQTLYYAKRQLKLPKWIT